MNQQFVDDQPIGTKRDQLMNRQTAVVAQFARFCDASRDVLAAEYRRERHILARQLRFQTGVPRSVFGRRRIRIHTSRSGPGDADSLFKVLWGEMTLNRCPQDLQRGHARMVAKTVQRMHCREEGRMSLRRSVSRSPAPSMNVHQGGGSVSDAPLN